MKKLFRKVFTLLAVFGALGISNKAQVQAKAKEAPKMAVKTAANPLIESVNYYGFKNIYEGNVDLIIDGDDSTRCWFGSAPSADAYIQLNLKEETRIRDVRILFDEADRMSGVLTYSTDGETFNNVFENVEDSTISWKLKVFDFRAKPLTAKYIRLTSNRSDAGAWVQMFDFSINNYGNRPYVVQEGFRIVPRDWNSLDNMIDEDMTTYTWLDWHNDAGATITVIYPEEQEVRSIHMITTHPDTQDHFQNMSFSYSTDGETFTPVGEEKYLDQKEVVVTLETPVRATYLRVTAPDVENSGFAIREFGINHEKVEAPITFENATPYTYSGVGMTPTYSAPYMTEVEVHYTYHSEFYSNDAPSKPGWYAMVVTVKESAYYKETSKFSVFCIQDTKEHFISEWNIAMEKGICDYARNEGDNSGYEYLLEVYNDCLPADVKAEVINYQWSETSTIGETMEYIAQLKALNTKQETAAEINSLLVKDNSNNTLAFFFIILSGLMIMGCYWLYYKKKYN